MLFIRSTAFIHQSVRNTGGKVVPVKAHSRNIKPGKRQWATGAQVSWEATPSTKLTDVAAIHQQPLSEKAAYLKAAIRVIRPRRRDLIADMIGMEGVPTIAGLSAWEGAVGAGAQGLHRVRVSGKGENRKVAKADREKLNLYCAALGYVLHQDAVVWSKPIYHSDPTSENGFLIEGSRALTEAEMVALYAATEAEFGTQDFAPGYTPFGAKILNFTDVPNPEFQSRMVKVLDKVHSQLPDFLGGKTHTKSFRSDGEYISNSWEDFNNGEEYTSRFSEAGRSDLSRRCDDLRAAIEKVNAKFDKRWTKKPIIRKSWVDGKKKKTVGWELTEDAADSEQSNTGKRGGAFNVRQGE